VINRQHSAALALAALLAGCSSLQPSARSLSPEEAAALSAFLNEEARHPENPARPILVLTPTDPRLDGHLQMPTEDLPDYVLEEIRKEIATSNSALRAVRLVNSKPVSLRGISLPPGAQLYPRERFEREYRSSRRFRSMVNRLGGLEPLVLSVSRPSVATGDGAVIEHVEATWSGCGGVNLFALEKSGDSWKTSLLEVLAVW